MNVPLFKGVKIVTRLRVNFGGLYFLTMNVLIEDRYAK